MFDAWFSRPWQLLHRQIRILNGKFEFLVHVVHSQHPYPLLAAAQAIGLAQIPRTRSSPGMGSCLAAQMLLASVADLEGEAR